MKKIRFSASLAAKITPEQRASIEHLATMNDLSLGEATREILSKGIEVMAINV
jgi:hypothetical protein